MTINLTLSLTELCLFFASAIVLGVTLHHFTAHRKQPGKKAEENATDGDYAEHTDTAAAVEDAVVTALKDQLRLSVEKVNILTIESEEFRWRHRTLISPGD